MDKTSKIFVAGHCGLVGSAIKRELEKKGCENLVVRTKEELNLLCQRDVFDFFAAERPEYVFVAAAKVGGILANRDYPAEFIFQNLQIEANLIHSAWRHGVKKLLFLGSSCIYPRECPQPIKEEYLLSGPLEPTNEPYAIAKIAGIKLCQSYHRQYGANFISLMPTNLYGPGDNFHPESSHVLPALIRRFHEAKKTNKKEVVIWGTGTAKREFLYVEDLARASVFLMENYDQPEIINVGSGEEISIAELAQIIKEVVGFKGEIVYDRTKPDGTPRKFLDTGRLAALGWRPETTLKNGVITAYEWYKDNENKINSN